ncbi:AT-rich interactive domain-containing protein 2 [Heracleum sosnowskyi]|uniref:AT-rich interactive domain-containing protein 2 n=1 Tax=Heracleum sosnowskyi TaxID=360622 RepID=A0AAD8HRY4_9APIA|nr:AT-rich interactive domain-containing protein 2 [Heracleum sosnowskyi]
MAGWLESKNGVELKNYEIDCESHNMSCDNLDFTAKDSVSHDCKDTLKSLFDQVIPIFLREISVGNFARPLPALLSNGQPVNLFQLFCVVKSKGGFSNVLENGLWGSVAEECGFSPALMSSIRFVYIKYLKELDGWLRNVNLDTRLENGEYQIFKKLALLIEESEELKGLHVCSDVDKWRNTGVVEHEFDTTGKPTDNYDGKKRSQLSDEGVNLNKVNHAVESSIENEEDICIQHDKSNTFSAKRFVDKVISSQKMKLCSDVEVNKVQNKVKASISYYPNKKLGVQDDYDILLSARSVVDKVISSMKSEFCPSPEVDNVRQTVANTYDNGKQIPNDSDRLLSAKRIVDKVVDSGSKVIDLCPCKGINAAHENSGYTKADYGKVHVPDNASVGNPVLSRKRKWEHISSPGLLKWITHVAKNSDDPAIGLVPEPSKWKSHGTNEYWVQALLAREAFLVKRPIDADLEVSSSQKMHPSIYEDINVIHKSAERVRCSKGFPLSKFQIDQITPISIRCNPGHATPRKLASPCKAETHNVWKVPSSPVREGILSRCALDDSPEEAHVYHVSVGLSFQAEIPEWTGVASESDSKWLGIQMCAPEDEHNNTAIDKHSIGKGRQSACDCSVSGSPACIRFHIAEKRLQLKLALGVRLFYRWKFNRMGEEVSLSWTTEEELRFKAMALQDSTGHNNFWNNAFGLFPGKTRENLVSYYFNVFVLRRRSYQNRVTPESIDSDDDETECGSLGESAYFAGNLAMEYDPPKCFDLQ